MLRLEERLSSVGSDRDAVEAALGSVEAVRADAQEVANSASAKDHAERAARGARRAVELRTRLQRLESVHGALKDRLQDERRARSRLDAQLALRRRDCRARSRALPRSWRRRRRAAGLSGRMKALAFGKRSV